jgi:hypothetical protein
MFHHLTSFHTPTSFLIRNEGGGTTGSDDGGKDDRGVPERPEPRG